MRIAARYSHLNGLEFLLVHQPQLWDEIQEVIANVDAEQHKTKVSKEKRSKGKLFYSPPAMNSAFKDGFSKREWSERRVSYYVTDEAQLTRSIMQLDRGEQRRQILAAGKIPFPSYNQTDFVKNCVMVEVQFGKYSFVAHDLFVKHMAFYTTGQMDVGVEILPTKALQSQMSSGVPYYEGALFDLIRQGRGVPHVPLVLVGVEPDLPVDVRQLADEAEGEAAAIEAGENLGDER